MTENESIEMLKNIQVDTRNLEHALKCSDLIETAVNALEELQEYRKLGTVEEVREAVKKQKMKKVFVEQYAPCECPTCGKELSKSLGDGYYKHYSNLKICPECGQKLDWGE